MPKTERQICLYSAVLISLMLNVGRLLALRENSIMAHFWHFNLPEFIFQLLAHFGLCYLIFYINLSSNWLSGLRRQRRWFTYILVNLAIVFFCFLVSGVIQRRGFHNVQLIRLFWAIHFTRMALAALLSGIIVKIVLLIRESEKHLRENEQLKSAYATAELELLKAQLNPHFLFNSLSSLSGLVVEDAELAQQYIKHLSNIFRYSLSRPATQLVTLSDELHIVQSYASLLQIRLEGAFKLHIQTPAGYLLKRLPHLSLQPLLENATKHNAATIAKPLIVEIEIKGDQLVVSNNLNPIDAVSNGIGLSNLNDRFRILVGAEISIEKTTDSFTVKLPLKDE